MGDAERLVFWSAYNPDQGGPKPWLSGFGSGPV